MTDFIKNTGGEAEITEFIKNTGGEAAIKKRVSLYLEFLETRLGWKGNFCASCNILWQVDKLHSIEHEGDKLLSCQLCLDHYQYLQIPFQPCSNPIVETLLSMEAQCLCEMEEWSSCVCPTCNGRHALLSNSGEIVCMSLCIEN